MKVLVTGASGFVGTALCRRLGACGVEVRGAVRHHHPHSPNGGTEGLAHLHGGSPADGKRTQAQEVAVGDVGPKTDWHAALAGVDTVVHLAARVHVMYDTAADPEGAYRRVNVEGTRRLAQQAMQAGVRRMILLSTIKVNGEASARPFTEADPPSPQDHYAVSKWQAEQALMAAAERGAMQWTVLRPPLVYGPGVGANFLRLMRAVRHGVPLPFGRLTANRRSLLYLGNLVDAVRCCVEHPAAGNRLFLVSDGEDLSTAELVRRLAHALHRRARLLPVPAGLLQAAGALAGRRAAAERLTGSLQVDGSRLRTDLGWRPPFDVEEGLAATARWYLEMVAKPG